MHRSKHESPAATRCATCTPGGASHVAQRSAASGPSGVAEHVQISPCRRACRSLGKYSVSSSLSRSEPQEPQSETPRPPAPEFPAPGRRLQPWSRVHPRSARHQAVGPPIRRREAVFRRTPASATSGMLSARGKETLHRGFKSVRCLLLVAVARPIASRFAPVRGALVHPTRPRPVPNKRPARQESVA
jgi:hypothetical protein